MLLLFSRIQCKVGLSSGSDKAAAAISIPSLHDYHDVLMTSLRTVHRYLDSHSRARNDQLGQPGRIGWFWKPTALTENRVHEH
jgi:hypothetical protein